MILIDLDGMTLVYVVCAIGTLENVLIAGLNVPVNLGVEWKLELE